MGSRQQQPSPEGQPALWKAFGTQVCRQPFHWGIKKHSQSLSLPGQSRGRGTAGLSRLGSLGVLVTTRAVGLRTLKASQEARLTARE